MFGETAKDLLRNKKKVHKKLSTKYFHYLETKKIINQIKEHDTKLT